MERGGAGAGVRAQGGRQTPPGSGDAVSHPSRTSVQNTSQFNSRSHSPGRVIQVPVYGGVDLGDGKSAELKPNCYVRQDSVGLTDELTRKSLNNVECKECKARRTMYFETEY